MAPITIVLADDHAVVRQGLKALLAAESDLSVVGEAEDGLLVVELVRRLQPDVAVLDMIMPGVGGPEVVQQVGQCSPRTRVIAFSMCDDDEYVWITLQCGAAAYVLKNAPADELVKAVREVMAGRRYLSPPLSDRAIDLYAHTPPPPVDETLSKSEQEIDPQVFEGALQNIDDVLTSREQEVLQLVAQGKTNTEIAQELNLSKRTVAHHIEHLLAKMRAANRTEAVAKASKWGWVGE